MKKIIGLVVSLTIISGVCAAVLAYVNSITADPIKATAEKAKEAAKLAVLCGEEGYTAEGRSNEGYGGDIVLIHRRTGERQKFVSHRLVPTLKFYVFLGLTPERIQLFRRTLFPFPAGIPEHVDALVALHDIADLADLAADTETGMLGHVEPRFFMLIFQ